MAKSSNSKESKRVGDYRKWQLEQGYKNVGFLLSPREYEVLQKAKQRYHMNTRELLMYFISGQYDRENWNQDPESDPMWHLSFDPVNRDQTKYRESQLQQDKKQGMAWDFHGCKPYLIAEFDLMTTDFPADVPFQVQVRREFDTLDDALDHCRSKHYRSVYRRIKTKQITLFQVCEPDQFIAPYWYEPKLHLNDARGFINYFASIGDSLELKYLQQEWQERYRIRNKKQNLKKSSKDFHL